MVSSYCSEGGMWQHVYNFASILQILESKRAIMEGLVPENINGLNK